jgi:hypothetical protein
MVVAAMLVNLSPVMAATDTGVSSAPRRVETADGLTNRWSSRRVLGAIHADGRSRKQGLHRWKVMRVYALPGCTACGLLPSRAGLGTRNGRLSLCFSARKPARKLNITVLPRLRANCCAEVMALEPPARRFPALRCPRPTLLTPLAGPLPEDTSVETRVYRLTR